MIVLTVLSLNGTASSIAAVQFDEMGGTIGRADSNQLVLPDQDRTISRLHAQVVYRNGRYALIDLGANAVLHNGQAIGHGREVTIQPGDTVEVGGYRIAVSGATAITRAHDPFAGFESDIAAVPAAYQSRAPHQPPEPAPRAAPAWPAAPAPVPASASPARAQAGGGIPEDWDPFQPDRPATQAGPAPYPAAMPLGAPPLAGGLPLQGSEPSLDDLFGLGSPSAPVAAPPVTRDDHASELSVPWTEVFAKPAAAVPASVPFLPETLVAPAAPVPPLAPPMPAMPMTPPAPVASDPQPDLMLSLSTPQPTTPLPPRAALPADAQALLDAFLKGLGMDEVRLRPVTPEAMQELGQLLREYTRGTMDLLVARGALKKEVRADVTMMASHANNVLKFSPTVEFALQHLLGTRSAGFMGSLDSVEDAFEDLKSHQLGVMAGMHAALQGVLKRFDPAEIERKVGAQSGLFSLVPSSRKARLWELFQEMYGQSASQAREEFDDLFGKAFAREYDRFVSELSSRSQGKK